jgi:hypothetical protein
MLAERCVRGGTRWASIAVGVLLVSMALVPCAQADRVYALVDYPAYQNGHALRGSITTTDDAPLDSLLTANEILSWNWQLSGANSLAATSTDFTVADKTSIQVRITESAIDLPQDLSMIGPAILRLGRATPTSRGSFGHHIRWQARPLLSPSTPENAFDAAKFEGDAVLRYWSTNFVPVSPYWTVAVAVPEPTSFGLGFVGACGVMLTRRVQRKLTCR